MPGDSTLVVTTQGGVRPLGVRGEPLHNSAPQLRRVVRRRLGDAAADLLANPQPHEDGKAIDWHAGWMGAVRALSDLDPARRDEVLADVERTLAEIRRLGDALAAAGPREDMGVVGLSLKLAARAPSPSFVFLVGDRPVIVAWGYEKEAAAALLPIATAQVPGRRSVLDSQQSPPPPSSPSLPALRPATTVIPWARSLAAALPLLLLVLAGAWLLRGCLPVDPAVTLATREGPPAPPAPPATPDPSPVLKASLATEASRARVLSVELSLVEAELKKRIADCKPPQPPKEPAKPPQVAVAPPPTPTTPPKTVAPTPPPASTQRPGDDRLRLPSPTGNMSFLEGCWRTDPFRHERNQPQAGVSTYCFDASGNGQLEWRRGRTACRTRAQARFEGAVLRLRDADTTCNDGSRWYADQLVCQRGADDVAQCSGSSRGGTFGPTTWTVNMHKLN